MSEEFPAAQPESPAVPDPSPMEAAKPQRPRGLKPELRAKLVARRPLRDRVPLMVTGVLLFLGFMFSYFFYNAWISTKPHRTEYVAPKLEMYPVTKLLSATEVKLLDEGGGKASVVYDFEQVAVNRPQLDKVLKDWRGPRNTLDQVRVTGRDHEPIQLDAGTGLPLTPLLSAVSFEGDLEYTVTFETVRRAQVWFFFHYIYDYEVTGPALMVSPDGQAQFVRYRRELVFDDPRGEARPLEIVPGKRQTVRIVVREFPMRAGYRCVAFQDEREVTRADFPPEWGDDRRYHRSEISRRLVADFAQPPQAGFLAVVSDPPRAVRLFRVGVEGTVSEAWRAERTRTRKILEDLLEPATPEEPKADEGAEEPESAPAPAPDAPTDEPAHKATP